MMRTKLSMMSFMVSLVLLVLLMMMVLSSSNRTSDHMAHVMMGQMTMGHG